MVGIKRPTTSLNSTTTPPTPLGSLSTDVWLHRCGQKLKVVRGYELIIVHRNKITASCPKCGNLVEWLEIHTKQMVDLVGWL